MTCEALVLALAQLCTWSNSMKHVDMMTVCRQDQVGKLTCQIFANRWQIEHGFHTGVVQDPSEDYKKTLKRES